MIATSGFLTALKCTKFVFGWGSAPDPTGELTALPRHPSWFKKNPTSIREGGEAKGHGRGRKRREERESRNTPSTIPAYASKTDRTVDALFIAVGYRVLVYMSTSSNSNCELR